MRRFTNRLPILLTIAATSAFAGEYCDNVPYECPGPLCAATKQMCQTEIENEQNRQQGLRDSARRAESANVPASTDRYDRHSDSRSESLQSAGAVQAEHDSKSRTGGRKIKQSRKAETSK